MTRILIADDEPLVRKSLRDVLAAHGFMVVEARDGDEALRICKTQHIDLLITDFLMPGLDGIDTILAIRRDFPDIGVIAISGRAQRGNLDFLDIARTFGAEYTFSKPFDTRDLVAAVHQLEDVCHRRHKS